MMITEAVIVALITAAATVIVQIVLASKNNSLVMYRLGELEAKMDKHNNLVERMAAVEQSTKSAHHRIDRVEGKE